MTDLVEIKARYPDSQVNALGKKDMDNIRWLITEIERLQAENGAQKEIVDMARAVHMMDSLEAGDCPICDLLRKYDKALKERT